jgi:ferredoxin--NADP+ reductase
MSESESAAGRYRVAIVGSGPAGFYTAEHLLKRTQLPIDVDMFERLPVPFGLVRFGVAPDHQKIKAATRAFERIADDPAFRFLGNVEIGRHLSVDDLCRHYHAVCLATGAETDRSMGIPGEDLVGSHAATEFVAWYNGHPDYADRVFDLSVERVAVVGVGNVAVDVARILCRLPEELAATDIADHALDALEDSRVRVVYILGRRGPAQAAFTNAEVRELGALAGADVDVVSEEIDLDPLSQEEVARSDDRALRRKLEVLRGFVGRPSAGLPRKLVLRFLVSPVELIGDDRGCVSAIRLVRNELYRDDRGSLRPKPTDHTELLPVGMVFRSVGYRGVPVPGVPFDQRAGRIPTAAGRVLDPETGRSLPGLYAAGWIKRGPTGVIGTNKPDAAETAECIAADLRSEAAPEPALDASALDALLTSRQPRVLTFADWRRLDAVEVERGRSVGRPRVKLVTADEVARALAERRR